MEQQLTDTAYFSLLRWVPDPSRDEARNIAVLMLDLEGAFGGLKAAQISSVSKLLAEQGLVDGVIESLRVRFSEEPRGTVGQLRLLQKSLDGPLVLTEPQPAAVVGGLDETLDSLYNAYVHRRQSRPQGTTKGQLLDRVMRRVRRAGWPAKRGQYYSDYLLDAVVDVATGPVALGVYSFRQERKTWGDIEKDVGYFVFATGDLDIPRAAVVEPPDPEVSREAAFEAHERVQGWLGRHEIKPLKIDSLRDPETLMAVASSNGHGGH